MRPRSTFSALTVAGLLLVSAGCADDADEPAPQAEVGEEPDEPAPQSEVGEDPDEAPTEQEPGAMENIESDSAEEDIIEDASGVLLGVEPACVEPGEELTVTAEGLEADAEHVVRFDPEPASPDVLEPSLLVRSDNSGEIEVDLPLPGDDVETGDFTLELLTAADGQAEGEPLIATDLEIADTCTP